jgi:NAD(P)H-flavin reductase
MKIDCVFSILVSNLRCVYLFQILRCGPPPMNKAMAAHLDELNYTKEMQFQF